jgi:hypothetical protein
MNTSPVSRFAVTAAALSLGIAAFPLPGRAADDPRAESVLRASAAALGVDALGRVHTLHLRGGARIAGVPGTVDSWQNVRDGSFAVYVDAGPLSGAGGYDGSRAWNRDAGGVVYDDASADARYAALDTEYLNRYGPWLPGHGGAAIAYAGAREDAGARYDVLRVSPPGGLPFELWLDARTHLPARSVTPIGRTTTVTRWSDYRAVDGLRVAFAQSIESEQSASAFTATAAEADGPAAPAMLRRPVSDVHDFSIANGTSTTIPFELVDNHVALPVTIDGKGPFTFIFDTGGQNLLDTGLAKELGIAATGGINGSGVGATTEAFQFATVGALGVGGATLRKQSFLLAPVRAGFGAGSGVRVDGLIGFDVLARFVTTFDYGAKRVVLATGGTAAHGGGKTIPFVFNGTQPMIACAIARVPGNCTVDTGSRIGLSVMSPFVAAHPAVVPPAVTAVGANGFGVGGPALGRLGRLTLSFGGFTVPDVVSDLSSQTQGFFADPFVAGNIGGSVWKRFAVTFDYAHETMTLVPGAAFAARDTYDRSGAFITNQAGKVVVVDVRPGTPAAAAGLARGDVLTAVDGRELGPGESAVAKLRALFLDPPGTVIRLGVAGKDGAGRTVSLTLRDYV